jgi:hypothetical protein
MIQQYIPELAHHNRDNGGDSSPNRGQPIPLLQDLHSLRHVIPILYNIPHC